MKRSVLFLAMTLIPVSTAMAEEADWNGFYASATIDNSSSRDKVDYAHSVPSCSNNNFGSDGGGPCSGSQFFSTIVDNHWNSLTGGLAAGYNWKINSWVVGIEPSIHFKHHSETYGPVLFPGFGDQLAIRSEQNYIGTLRAVIGYPVQNVLFYATGGASVGDVDTIVTQSLYSDVPRVLRNNDMALGYSAGGGLKYHLAHNWVIGGEFLYVDLGSQNISAPFTTYPSTLNYPTTNVRIRNTSAITQFSLSYQF